MEMVQQQQQQQQQQQLHGRKRARPRDWEDRREISVAALSTSRLTLWELRPERWELRSENGEGQTSLEFSKQQQQQQHWLRKGRKKLLAVRLLFILALLITRAAETAAELQLQDGPGDSTTNSNIYMIPPLNTVTTITSLQVDASLPTTVHVFATWPPAPHSFSPISAPDVAPPPFTTTTMPPSTKPPTNAPTLAPSPNPTVAPITLEPSSGRTTKLPVSSHPSQDPSQEPSILPSNRPNQRPSTLPSQVPSIRPSDRPSSRPTNRPTTTAPITSVPTVAPFAPPGTRTPTLPPSPAHQVPTATATMPTQQPIRPNSARSPTVSPTPSRQLFENHTSASPDATTATGITRAQVSVPFDFTVTLQLADQKDASLRDVILIWQDYLLDILTQQFASEDGVKLRNVDLIASRTGRRAKTRQRILQQQQTPQELFLNGSAIFLINEQTVDWKDFSNRVQMALKEATTNQRLQQALIDAGNTTQIVVVAAPNTNTTSTTNDDQSDIHRIPTNVELVIGFTILFAAILSLCYWADLLWKQRIKKIRSQQMEAVRQQALRTARVAAAVAPLPKIPVLQTLTSEDDDREVGTSPRIASPMTFPGAVTDGELSYSTSTTERRPSDPFALELQRAVSRDRRAWEAYRKRQEVKQQQQQNATQYQATVIEGVEVTAQSVNTSSVISFPYGDEELRGFSPAREPSSPFSNLPPMRESSRSVERKAPARGSRRKQHQARSNTSNNIDEHSLFGGWKRETISNTTTRDRLPLSQSWDLEETPVVDDRKPAQFSFLHPLRRRDIEADIPNTTEGSSSNDETTTSGAVRESIDVTTVDSKDQGRESKENDPITTADSEKDWPTSLTETMLREVEYIAQFVRRYEQKHNKRTTTKKSKPGELYDDSGEVMDEATMKQEMIEPPLPQRDSNRSALQPVSNSAALEEGRTHQPTKLVPRVEPSRSPLVKGDDGRLGIGRFSIGRPVTNRSSQFDSKPSQAVQFHDRIADVSPIHSSEEEPGPKKGPEDPFQSHGRLSSLRSNESILDITPTEEFAHAPSTSPRQVSNESTSPAATLASRRQRLVEPLATKQQDDIDPRRRPRKKVSPRSQNMTFNSIRSIFESKETHPIVPPNDSWQYTGTRPGSGSSLGGDSFWS